VSRWVQIALVALAVVAVGALVYFVIDAHHRNSHEAMCAAYHAALVVAYDDPMSEVPPAGLNKVAAAFVVQNRAVYRTNYDKADQPMPDILGGPPRPIDPATLSRLPTSWQTWATTTAIPNSMAQRGC